MTALQKRRFQFEHKAINDEDFHELVRFVKSTCGINLSEDKTVFIETRLRSRLSSLGLDSFNEYIAILRRDEEEKKICIEHLTTHKTEWFREKIHYEWIARYLRKQGKKSQPLMLWSAACSRGPEVYSLMLLLLKEGYTETDFKILGTDISRAILNEAIHLPQTEDFAQNVKSFIETSGDKVLAKDQLRRALQKSIKFREFNLTNGSLPLQLEFDIVLLRNVLIYFDRPTIKKVCLNLGRYMRPGGHLILGLTESLHNEIPEFENIGDSVHVYNPRAKR